MRENSLKGPSHDGCFSGLAGEIERVGFCAGAGVVSADEPVFCHTANDDRFDDAVEVVNFEVEVWANRNLEISENLDFDTIGTSCYNAL